MEDNREKRRLEETCASDICAYRGHGVCDFTEGMFCPMYIPKTEEVDNVIKESKSVRFPEKHDGADSCSADSGLMESDFGDKYMTSCGKQALFIRVVCDNGRDCALLYVQDYGFIRCQPDGKNIGEDRNIDIVGKAV